MPSSAGAQAVERFRPATPADATEIARIFIDAWEAAYPGVLEPDVVGMWDLEQTAATMRELVLTPGDATIVALGDDGAITGFTRFGPDPGWPARGRIHSVYVAPAASRRGIGTSLLRLAVEALRAQGLDDAALWVFEANGAARALYASLGFVADGVRRVEPQFRAPEIQMVRALGDQGPAVARSATR